MAKLKVQSVDKPGVSNAPVLAEFGELENRVRERAYDLFARRGFGPSSALDDWLAAERQVFGPAAELVEGKDKYVLKVALAGYDPDDIDVTATPDELFVKATFEAKQEKKGEREGEVVHWSEFRSGNVYRHIDLPRAIDTDKVAAKLKDGILTVEAPVMKTKGGGAKKTKPKKAASAKRSTTKAGKKSSKKTSAKKRASAKKSGTK